MRHSKAIVEIKLTFVLKRNLIYLKSGPSTFYSLRTKNEPDLSTTRPPDEKRVEFSMSEIVKILL